MRAAGLVFAVLAAATVAACGNEPAKPDAALLVPSAQTRVQKAPDAGLSVALPANLSRQQLKSPGLFFAVLGRTTVSVYAYKRGEQLPRNKKELDAARKRLVSSTKKRDKSYKLISAKSTKIGGARAVTLLGEQKLSGEKVRIRSIHVFKGNVEYVIEVFSPASEFEARDGAITPGILKTLKVTGKFKSDKKKAKKKKQGAKTTTQTSTTPAQTTTQP